VLSKKLVRGKGNNNLTAGNTPDLMNQKKGRVDKRATRKGRSVQNVKLAD
jgi:hypothetical protein